ncbi:hypothetical protein [Nonomuraea jiangxiensis]|uniref:Uncharacterized protein n=1 Tax=Nonomuraea jiangxiensis TaxID=633440 RepID=A0A1G9A7N3_9ACTN|nr:hypothetical protein [Nonomuraea jiangxiensis]SDK22635.1 hypothetical protein SAMN05421869_114283 [Nonomuraea jiangxiensis]
MNIVDLARVRDEELVKEPVGRPSGTGARALLESIMAEERTPVRRPSVRRRAFGLAAVATLAAVLVVGVPFGGPVTEYANAAVSLKTGGNYIEVVINDPEADAAAFTEAFRAVGLDAEVKKAPVAPEDVGKLVGPVLPGDFPTGTGVTITHEDNCASAWCGKISMPVHYTGKVVFGIGRPAAPGERYATPVSMSPPPESDPLGGDKARGKRVSEVRTDMERLGLKISYLVMWQLKPDGSGGGYNVDAEHIDGDWTVADVRKTASDAVEVMIQAGPDVPPNSLPQAPPPPAATWWQD